jgi:arylsulfatase
MMGNRGIWVDGWKAVAFHPRGADFDNDHWELYHLDSDFSESGDLAAEMPDKLAELVAMWWQEAGRNQVLPLDDRGLERYVVPKPRPITDRTTYRYLPGVYVPTEAMPNLRTRSYRITARVESMRADDQGVLIACGDATVGYALFVQDGHLVHDYNCAGEHFTVRSSVPVPIGAKELSYAFELTGPTSGVGTLQIDGAEVGSVAVPKLLTRSLASVGLMIGESPSHSVHPTYEAPFIFTGELVGMTVELL